VLGANASMRVRRGALEIDHGPAVERVNLRIDIDDAPPCAILFDGRGEFLSGEALRWCARRGVVLVIPDGPGRMMTFLHSAAEASDSATLPDVGPGIIRAQCVADAVAIAREIVRTKIAADKSALGPRVTERDFKTIAGCEAKLIGARSVAEIIVIEAKAASVYWRSWRDLGLIERKGGNLPASWKRFAYRGKGPEFLGNKHAAHPISAMIASWSKPGDWRGRWRAKAWCCKSASFTVTNMGGIVWFGIASNRCGRGSMRVSSNSFGPANSPAQTSPPRGSRRIGLRDLS
jgi:hypothetical protein